MTNKNNCYFSVLKYGHGLSQTIASVYLLTDDGKRSFYGEIASFDTPENIKDSMYYPSKKLDGDDWEIRDTKVVVRKKLLEWLLQNYKTSVQMVGDGNELDFVILREFISEGAVSINKPILIEPTMDNINIGLSDLISDMADGPSYDGYIMIAYHADREEILAYIDKEFDFEPEYDQDKDFFTDFKKSVWIIRDIKRFLVNNRKITIEKRNMD